MLTNIYLKPLYTGGAEIRATDEAGKTYIVENATLALFDLIKEKGYTVEQLQPYQRIMRININK